MTTGAESQMERVAKDMLDGVMKQARAKIPEVGLGAGEIKIDPETLNAVVQKEIRMATDADFALGEAAKRKAAARMNQEAQTPQAPATGVKGEPEKDKQKINQEIGVTAKAMLDMGIPANVVAQYLTSSSTPQFPIAFAGGGNQGLTLADVLTLVDRMNASKATSELETIIKEMRDEIKALKNTPPAARVDPVAAQTSQVEGLSNLVESLIKLGVVQRPGTEVKVEGEPLEVVKEKNRHTEKLAEITVEKDYKETVGKTLSELPERIGAGVANHLFGGREEKVSGKSVARTELFVCQNKDDKGTPCGTQITVPAEAAKIECPKCHMVYGK